MQPNSEQTAKSSAIMYAIDRAAFSVNRNPSLDFSKEAQYMFTSHYIDRYDYYWSDKDEKKLLDGTAMSGENGYLADWLTGNDCRSYQLYMGHTGINTSLQQVGDIAIGFLSYRGTPGNIAKCTDALVKANKVYAAAYGMVLSDELTGISDVWQKDVVPLVGNAFNSLEKDPTVRLEQLYDMYMNDDGYLGSYNESDKSTIILTAVSMVWIGYTKLDRKDKVMIE